MVSLSVAQHPKAAATAAALWVSTMAIAQGAAVEARLMFAVRSSRRGTSQGEEAAVTVRDLAEEPAAMLTVAEAVATRGFATLRPALGENYFGQEELKAQLQDHNPAAAAALLADHLSDDGNPEFAWVTCGSPVERRGGPASAQSLAPLQNDRSEDRRAGSEPAGDASRSASSTGAPAEGFFQSLCAGTGPLALLVRALLLRLPSVARLLKVWFPLRVLVQPLALLDAQTFDPIAEGTRLAAVGSLSPPALHKPGQRWWWHSSLGLGDAVVLDALRCPHSTFTLPGEAVLARTLEAVDKLRGVLPSGKLSILPGSDAPSLQEALKVCSELDSALLDPAPYPVVGERYAVLVEPSALVRRHESVESDVIAEIRPGGVVTILATGQDGGHGRAKVYTEHAVMAVESFTDGGELPGVAWGSRSSSVTGWVSTDDYDGERLLEPQSALPAGETPPFALAAFLADLGKTLAGICSWINVTAGTAGTSPPSTRASFHSAHISDRHERTLATLLEEAQHHSFQVQCLAVAMPTFTSPDRKSVV